MISLVVIELVISLCLKQKEEEGNPFSLSLAAPFSPLVMSINEHQLIIHPKKKTASFSCSVERIFGIVEISLPSDRIGEPTREKQSFLVK